VEEKCRNVQKNLHMQLSKIMRLLNYQSLITSKLKSSKKDYAESLILNINPHWYDCFSIS